VRAILSVIRADLGQRRLQTAVVTVIVILVSATTTMALSVLTLAVHPFQQAFDDQRGGHVVVFLSRTATAEQITQAAASVGARVGGPFLTTTVSLRKGQQRWEIQATGRGDPGGDVEQLRLVAGRWHQNPGEVVLTKSFADLRRIGIGDRVSITSITPGRPLIDFTVVGEVVDVDDGDANFTTQWSWMSEADVHRLAPDDAIGWRVPFRFDHSPAGPELTESLIRMLATLPPDVYLDSQTYLELQKVFTVINSLILSFLVAFSVFALVAAAAIVANLVAGIVIASYRQVGIVKALGFTPAQVVQVFLGHMLVPTLAGCLVGVPLGTVASQPILNYSSRLLGLPARPIVSVPVDLAALAGVLLAVALAALVPALRGGRLSAVRALTVGSSPNPTRASRLAHRASRLRRLPRPVSLGVGEVFVRPARSLVIALAIMVGVAALTFAYGLRGSLQLFVSETSSPLSGVLVVRTPSFSDARAMQIIDSQPEVSNVVAVTSSLMVVSGVDDPVLAWEYRGDSSKLDLHLFKGRWFNGPGEAVAPAGFLRDSHLQLGDTFTGTIGGRPLTLRIVGEVFDLNGFGHTISIDYSNLATVGSAVVPDTYYVQTRPGTDDAAVAQRIYQADPTNMSAENPGSRTDQRTRIMLVVVVGLALVLLVVAVVGVFNAVLLGASERNRDVAILKAIGMTYREIVQMVVSSACVLGLLGGAAGVAVGVALHHYLLDFMGGIIGNDIPPVIFTVFRPLSLTFLTPVLVVCGLLLGLAGAMLPARWAARRPVVAVLHAE
jgi:putative ABC transport system permease protein